MTLRISCGVTFGADNAIEFEVTETTGNRYTITYQISTANTFVPVSGAAVVVTATDAFDRSVADTSITLSVMPGTSNGPAGLSVSPNSFRPLDGGSVTVGLGSYDGSVTIEIYNMAGTRVRTLKGDGASDYSWYGDNDSGDTVASGVYFLRIQTDGDETIRKVAVIK